MAGRTRKTGDRYPGGKLKPEDKGAAPALAARIERLAKQAKDPAFGTPLGMMLVRGEISAWEVEAGLVYQGQRRRYDVAIAAPSRSARSCDLNTAGGGGRPQGATGGGNGGLAYERTYAAVFDRLGHAVGRQAIDVLDRVIMLCEAPANWELSTLKAGLYAVAEHNGLAGDPNKRRKVSLAGGRVIYTREIGPRDISTDSEDLQLDKAGQIIAA